MNLTLSVDDQTVAQARRVAQAMNKSLNQVIREYLEQLARRDQAERDIAEFRALSPSGTRSWKFNRDEIYDRKIFSR
jgi:predicted transcriptional regulator